jgi:hypothetical protein
MNPTETGRTGLRTGGELSPKQEAVAVSLAAGMTLQAAAAKHKAGLTTVKTWLYTLPAFGRRVSDLRGEMTAAALGRLIDGMASAADTLGYLARQGKSETVRLMAARAVIEMGTRMREAAQLEERVAALENGQRGAAR